MATIKHFEDLSCWQASQKLISQVYQICKSDSLKHEYVLRDQLKRASLSVSNNIAEGFERISNKEYIRFLVIANGSISEVKSMILTLRNIQLIQNDNTNELLATCLDTQKQLKGLIKYLYDYQK